MRSHSPQAANGSAVPKVVLSLDFELRWGVHDVYGLDFSGYRRNLEGVRNAIPALLKLFDVHHVHATWATVGAIGCENWDEYFARAPRPPRYKRAAFAVNPEYAVLDANGSVHFAPDLIRQIVASPGQELGSHTFSHLYLREEGVTAEDVAADFAAIAKLFEERFGITPRSLVFPRNQPAFPDIIRTSTIKVWRGNPEPWYYECEDSEHNGPLPRALKLIDAVNPVSRRAAPLEGDMTRASLFLRLNFTQYLWSAHLAKIKRELASLRPNDVLHLWFHPHNLGQNMKLRLSRVEQVIELIAERAQRGELVSCTMGSLVSD
jgi:hypothetical protein